MEMNQEVLSHFMNLRGTFICPFLYGISFSFNYCFLSTVWIDGLFITVHGMFF